MTRSPTTAPARNAGNKLPPEETARPSKATEPSFGKSGRGANASATRKRKRGDNDGSEAWLHRFTKDQLELNGAPGILWMHTGLGLQRPGKAMNMLKGMGVRVGASDFLICVSGKAHWLELKAPGKEPNDAQLKFIEDARASGCPAYVADNPLEVRQILYAWAAINIMPDYGEIA